MDGNGSDVYFVHAVTERSEAGKDVEYCIARMIMWPRGFNEGHAVQIHNGDSPINVVVLRVRHLVVDENPRTVLEVEVDDEEFVTLKASGEWTEVPSLPRLPRGPSVH